MAEYTDNYNLSMPEQTDTQADFISAYRENMGIIDDNLGGGGGGGGATMLLNTIYSDTEKKIGYWRDNKPLYQKAVDIGSLPSNDTKTVAHGVSDIDLIVSCKGFVYNSSYTFLPLPSINVDSLTYGIQLECDRTNINVKTKETWMNIYSGFVVIQYTKTTDTPEPNPEFGNTIYLPTIYSEEEKQVGVWLDNKPLYQKSFVIDTSNLNTGWNDISSGLSGIDCKDITGKFRFPTNDNSIYEFPYTENSAYCLYGGYKPSNDTIFIYKGSGFATISDFVITLRYTKNTDTAGSGNWNTDGVPTHHYSTNEQVVGTWFGDTLYQATIQTAIPNNTQVNYPHGIANIDKIVGIDGGAWDGSQYLPINMTGYVSGNNEGALRVTVTKTDIAILPLLWDGSSYTGYWTIRYTKTTN